MKGGDSRLAVHAALRVVPAASATADVLHGRTPACPRARGGRTSLSSGRSPRARMLRAALASAWSSWPQFTHRNTAWLSRLADAMWPHARHCCEVKRGSTETTVRCRTRPLHASGGSRGCPSRRLGCRGSARPWHGHGSAGTRRAVPGRSGSQTCGSCPSVFRFSSTRMSWSRTRRLETFYAQSRRLSVTLAVIFAMARRVVSRRRDPFRCRASRRCRPKIAGGVPVADCRHQDCCSTHKFQTNRACAQCRPRMTASACASGHIRFRTATAPEINIGL